MASPGSGGGRQDANRRGPLERRRHPEGRNVSGGAGRSTACRGRERAWQGAPPTPAPPGEASNSAAAQAATAALPGGGAAANERMAPGRRGRVSGAGSGSADKAALVASLAKPGAPPDREDGVPAGPPPGAAPCPAAQPSGSVRPQPRSIRSADADPRQPIATARLRPGDGARRREAWLRAVERGRAASPARGVCFPPSCEPFGIFFAILKSVVPRAAVLAGTDPS